MTDLATLKPLTASQQLREALLCLSQHKATITGHREKHWVSITYAGERHEIDMVFEGADATAEGERFIDRVPESLFDIPGQLVADVCVTEVDHQLADERMQVTVEVLLLENGPAPKR